MKILSCDWCHAKVNDYSHWYGGVKARNMYELKCVHDTNGNNSGSYDGLIICSKCLNKLVPKTEEQPETEVQDVINILRVVHEYCDNKEDCKGCPYAITPRPGRIFMSCALSGSPLSWELDKEGGEHNEQ